MTTSNINKANKDSKDNKALKRYRKTFLTDFTHTLTSTRLCIKVIDSPLNGCITQTDDIQSLTIVLEDSISILEPFSIKDTEVVFIIQEPTVSVQGLFLNTLVTSIELERD